MRIDKISEYEERWEIPLTGHTNPDLTDNEWIVLHLRHLADKIEQENPKITSLEIKNFKGYGLSLTLEVQ